ncbi:hypothetical protein LWF15_05840 [Kineosporia rhizophila]|uniref:hypothetical protein n=1 Tax=Kineosporia TaxID=49184 RepID=UPI000A50193F|nr:MULTISPECIES: hypothetical protein [Kineosporia]MCE0535025.1 hypothetical protein [Kineosporia rhizophila]GLY14691.1 hypothetical protein Kisp01_17060 [Kineosporia sp. NBRC 101677]
MKRAWMLGAAVALALGTALTGCSDQLGDRGGDEGAPPDKISDVDYIEVYRNADNFPNIARICIRGIAFASTSSGVRGESGYAAPSLLRLPEWDQTCPGAVAPTPTASPTPTVSPS